MAANCGYFYFIPIANISSHICTHLFTQSEYKGIVVFDNQIEGKPLVFLHGLGANASYGEFMQSIFPNRRIWIPDLPGHGISKSITNPDIYQICLQLLELFDHYGIENPILAGHSLGGQIALLCDIVRPGYCKSLLLFSPAGLETFSTMQKQIIMASWRASSIFQGFISPALEGIQIPGHGKLTDTDTIADYMQSMMDRPVKDLLDKVQCEVKVFIGSNDMLVPNRLINPTFPFQFVQNTIGEFKNFEAIELSGFSHWPMVDNAPLLIKTVKEKLQSMP